MSKSYRGFVCLLAAQFILAVITSSTAFAQSRGSQEIILSKVENKPLASLRQAAEITRSAPVISGPPRQVVNFSGMRTPARNPDTAVPDALIQKDQGARSTTIGSGFHGASNDDNGDILGFMIAPPDTDGQVGARHFVQMINLLTTIFDKNGNIEYGPEPSSTFWLGIGGNCEAYNQGDPIVLYDEGQDRWLVSQFAFPDSLGSFSQCVAISQTGDPTAAYNRYEFSFDGIGFNDYPKHGIVSDSITMMANLFTKRGRRTVWGGTFLGVMDKAAMYAGAPASLIGFNIGTAEFGFVAGDLDGGGSAPALFGTAMTSDALFDIWQIDVDWSMEAASHARIARIPITQFDSVLCSASRDACIPQPLGGPALESLADRLMHRLQIRDFGTYRTMLATHTVDVGGGRAGIRWYEFREIDEWSLYQEGTYAPDDGLYRWMPSIAMNSLGDIGLGYMVASTETYVSTAVSGQSASTSGSGSLDSDEVICATGSGVQLDVARSGDYSSTSVDPGLDTFWHTNEVFTTTGSFNWDTYICEFAVADGGGGNRPPVAGFSYGCTELDCVYTDNSSDPDGSLTAWDWEFGDGDSSVAQNPSHSYAGDGSYTVTLTVTDNEGATDSDTQILTVGSTPPPNEPPGSAFTFDCTDLDCNFTDASTDADGSVVAWSWDFGDGNASADQNPDHSYAAEGTWTVTLTVTDDDDATDSSNQAVQVTIAGESILTGSSQKAGRTWTARVSDSDGDLDGSWNYNGSASCNDAGVCTLGGISRRTASVVFTEDVNGIPGREVTVSKP